MLAQLVAVHAPDDLRVAVCAAADRMPAWEWVKWLPHAAHPDQTDAARPDAAGRAGSVRSETMLDGLLATGPGSIRTAGTRSAARSWSWSSTAARSHGSDHLDTGGGLEGVVVLDLGHAPPRALDRGSSCWTCRRPANCRQLAVDGRTAIGGADALTVIGAEALARQLAPLRLTGADAGGETMPLAPTSGWPTCST